MTERQERLYRYLLTQAGALVQPTLAEMAMAIGMAPTSKSAVQRMLEQLKLDGLVVRERGGNRVWRAVQLNPIEKVSGEAMVAELRRRGFLVTIEREKKDWQVCPDCNGDSPNWPGNQPGCQACGNEGGWAK